MMKPLYMAQSIEDLQSHARLPPKTSLLKLLKSGDQLIGAGNKAFSDNDEEKAYVMYMKFVLIFQYNQKTGNIEDQKQRMHSKLGSSNVKSAMERLEELQKSLDRRYNKQYCVPDKKEIEPIKVTKKISSNSNDKCEAEGTILCKKLYSLIKQKSTSFLVVDVRPKEDFQETSIDISNMINIPEEVFKPCLTANSAGRCLDENSRLLWGKRTSCDILIICDFKSEKAPFAKPVNVLLEAILKWDPGKKYKSKPYVLFGGFDTFRLTYPMLIKNPLANNLEINHLTSHTTNNTILDFNYPDLDTAFVRTPSPPKVIKITNSLPIVNRDLKPSVVTDPPTNWKLREVTEPSVASSNAVAVSGTTTNGVLTLVEKFDSLGSKQKSQENSVKQTIQIDVQPEIPCRTLKPKELMEKLKDNKYNLDKEQETLELSVANEQDTLEKLQEMEKTKNEKNETEDTLQKQLLNVTEQKLREDVAKMKHHSEKLESDFGHINQQNQQLWTLIREYLESEDSIKNSVKTLDQTEVLDIMDQRNKRMRELEKRFRKLKKKRIEQEMIMEPENGSDDDAYSHQSRHAERVTRPHTHENWSNGRNFNSHRRGDVKSSPRTSPIRGGSNLRRSHSAFNIVELKDDEDYASPVLPSFDRRFKPADSPQKRTVNAARQRNFGAKIGNVGRGRTGLRNLGNTCYMNSIIQCLNNTIPLAQFFMKNSYGEKINENSRQKGIVAEETAAVIRVLWSGIYKSISMWDLKNIVAKHHKAFFGFDQQDSHEFLLKMMDWLNGDLNTIKNIPTKMIEQNFDNVSDHVAADMVTTELDKRDNSIIRKLFHGLHQSVITCTFCDHRSITFEPFTVLTISLPTSGPCALMDLIRDYYRISEIDYKCAKCNTQRKCTRKMNIWTVPPVLIIHLNRFEQDELLMKKNPNYVDFPIENVDLSAFTVSMTNKHEYFHLYAVSNHYGTMDGGHYTAYCHSQSYGWLKFDDNEVYEMQSQKVKTALAYILFYQVGNLNSS